MQISLSLEKQNTCFLAISYTISGVNAHKQAEGEQHCFLHQYLCCQANWIQLPILREMSWLFHASAGEQPKLQCCNGAEAMFSGTADCAGKYSYTLGHILVQANQGNDHCKCSLLNQSRTATEQILLLLNKVLWQDVPLHRFMTDIHRRLKFPQVIIFQWILFKQLNKVC